MCIPSSSSPSSTTMLISSTAPLLFEALNGGDGDGDDHHHSFSKGFSEPVHSPISIAWLRQLSSSSSINEQRKRPRRQLLREARMLWEEGMKRPANSVNGSSSSWCTVSTSRESSNNITSSTSTTTSAPPEPDSTTSIEEEEISFLGTTAAASAQLARECSYMMPRKRTKTQPQKKYFSFLLHMEEFKPRQISVKVQPDRRTLEVTGIREKGTLSTNNRKRSGLRKKKYLEHVKRLKMPANVNVSKMICYLDQNGWLQVKAPWRKTLSSNASPPDLFEQWASSPEAPLLIPVKVIVRK